jgi:hypothetical protein
LPRAACLFTLGQDNLFHKERYKVDFALTAINNQQLRAL